MPFHGEDKVIVQGAVVVWDAITSPEMREDGNGGKKPYYQLKVVLPAGSPEIAEVDQLAQRCLAQSKWRGQLPPGAHWAISPVEPGKYNDMFVGGYVINPSSGRIPEIYDDQGNRLTDPMQYAPLIYQGQKVSIIVNCWDYDNKSKGIKAGLEAVRIHVSENAPRQQFGEGGFDASGIFGNGQQMGGQQMGGQMGGGMGQQMGGQQMGGPVT